MEVDDEIVDQVDAVIAALQKYRDNEPEVSLLGYHDPNTVT